MNIVLVSEAGAGKDTVYEILNRHYGYNRYAFADHVKSIGGFYFPNRYNETEKDRKLLQDIGTKMREIDPDVWINAMFYDIEQNRKDAERLGYSDELIVVTDCRMPNEYNALKERGFIFIRLTVDEEIRVQRMKDRGDKFTEDDLKHHTETFYDTFECDYEISNNGTLDDLKYEIDNVMNQIMKG